MAIPTPPLEHPTQTMRLMVVSREMAGLRPLWSIVESNAWELETAASPWEALERVQSGVAPHLLILDLPRGDGDGLHILRWLRRLRPDLPTVLLCHTTDADKKRDAIRMGANEVLIRPFRAEHLEVAIYRYLSRTHETAQPELTSGNIDALDDGRSFVSGSAIMQKLRIQAELLAQTDVPVLIVGEKGSGKKTLARLIHQLSVRSGFNFLKVGCADKPSHVLEKELFTAESAPTNGSPHPKVAKFESTEKGTILLDEITEMPPALQARLLYALQERHSAPSDHETELSAGVRVLASTSANVERAIAEKRLREDLYYKLSAFTVHVPPLRERKQEISLLLRHFMHSLARHYGLPPRNFSRQVTESCENYWWPGNVAELEIFVKRYLVAGDSDLVLNNLEPKRQATEAGHPYVPATHPGAGIGEAPPQSLRSLIQGIKSETERNAIGLALERTGWNRKAAARLLKVSYRTLLYKIEQYQMKASDSFLSPLPINGTGNKGKVG
jgi:two-component system, NtrC family, response regulator AtoC